MGQLYMKIVTVNGTVILHQHYLYRGYLQIAALDLTRSNAPALWYLHWDPIQPVATRPLSLRKNGTWYTYGHDLTKNVTELYKADGTIATAYDYTPYGTVTATGIDQPIQWSSEHYEPELALVYYNYRHYNPLDGRWINRDPIAEEGGRNLYGFVRNNPSMLYDLHGLVKMIYATKTCRYIALFLVKFIFEDVRYEPVYEGNELQGFLRTQGRSWNANQKDAFKNKFYRAIRQKWNNQKTLISTNPNCCCKTLKLQVAIDEATTSSYDFVVYGLRLNDPYYREYQWRNGIYLLENTNPNIIPHEFGHIVWLQHPNAGKIDPQTGEVYEPNSEGEYRSNDGKDIYNREVSENDLMGLNPQNSIMRDFYYDSYWKNTINSYLPECNYTYKQ